LNQPDLEFVWVGDDAVDPLQQAQTLNILVGAGIKTREEARADLGLAPEGGKSEGLGKWNFDPDQPRDEWGRWTSDGGIDPPGTKRPEGVQVAFNDAATTMTDAGGPDIGSDNLAEVIPICIPYGISIVTDNFGNKTSTCHYECFGGETFIRVYPNGDGCPIFRAHRF
jgi:hypothetical protein